MTDEPVIYFGNMPFTIDSLGEHADKSLADGLQGLLDSGMLGEEYIGKHWTDAVVGIKLTSIPTKDDEIEYPLYQKLKEVEMRYLTAKKNNEPLGELLQEMSAVRDNLAMARKLMKDETSK